MNTTSQLIVLTYIATLSIGLAIWCRFKSKFANRTALFVAVSAWAPLLFVPFRYEVAPNLFATWYGHLGQVGFVYLLFGCTTLLLAGGLIIAGAIAGPSLGGNPWKVAFFLGYQWSKISAVPIIVGLVGGLCRMVNANLNLS